MTSYLIIFLSIGFFLILTSCVGIIRFKDFYLKMHVLSISDSLGFPLVLLSLAMIADNSFTFLKILIIIGVMIFTAPYISYMLSLAKIKETGKND